MKNLNKMLEQDKIENLKIENLIKDEKKISANYLNVYIDWFEDCSASTIGFLVRKLKLIKSIIEEGNPVTIEEEPVLILNTQEDLKNWIKNRFDESLLEDVYKE